VAVVADSTPLIAAANRGDNFHRLALSLVMAAGRDLIIPDPVVTEVDWMVRDRGGLEPARRLLNALVAGAYQRATLSPSLFAAACAIDRTYADLDLGLVDASVMAVAAATDSVILTFDFAHFRAAPQARGRAWRLMVDEAEYEKWRGRQ
jgi:predicted nucleic acid-binding protein